MAFPKLAAQLAALRHQRAEVAEQVEALVDAHPLSKVLITMPGVGTRTCARIPTEIAAKTFASAGRLAAYAWPDTGHPPLRQQDFETNDVSVGLRLPKPGSVDTPGV